MDIRNIIYYRRSEDKSQTLSLRNLCLKEEEYGLEKVFYTARDAMDTANLLESFQNLCCEKIELDSETPSYIRFIVTDAYDNVNYLKFKKANNTRSPLSELRIGV